jgi:16S rRNA (cytosine1402-N4)-methyltransferase
MRHSWVLASVLLFYLLLVALGLPNMLNMLRTGLQSSSRVPRHFFVVRHCSGTDSSSDEVAGGGSQQQQYEYHLPVMLEECLDHLRIKPGGVYLDCTLGGGGHSKAILDRGGYVIGLDQDSDAIARASIVCKDYIREGKMEIFQTNFRNSADTVLSRSKLLQTAAANRDSSSGSGSGSIGADGVLMDLGISSHQIDEASRGFAFGSEGPLDMRMEQQGQTQQQQQTGTAATLTAATIVNEWDVDRLANVLYEYGDETRSRQIAREIVATRPHTTTFDVKEAISKVTSFKRRSPTLARCFQALRIVVNDEMSALDEALDHMHRVVLPGGRLVIMSYHSLEDKRVKNLIKTGSASGAKQQQSVVEGYTTPQQQQQSVYDLGGSTKIVGPWKPCFKRAVGPSEEEMQRNRRSRSAKLRVAERRDDNNGDNDGDTYSGRRVKSKAFAGKKQLQKQQQQD